MNVLTLKQAAAQSKAKINNTLGISAATNENLKLRMKYTLDALLIQSQAGMSPTAGSKLKAYSLALAVMNEANRFITDVIEGSEKEAQRAATEIFTPGRRFGDFLNNQAERAKLLNVFTVDNWGGSKTTVLYLGDLFKAYLECMDFMHETFNYHSLLRSIEYDEIKLSWTDSPVPETM